MRHKIVHFTSHTSAHCLVKIMSQIDGNCEELYSYSKKDLTFFLWTRCTNTWMFTMISLTFF